MAIANPEQSFYLDRWLTMWYNRNMEQLWYTGTNVRLVDIRDYRNPYDANMADTEQMFHLDRMASDVI